VVAADDRVAAARRGQPGPGGINCLGDPTPSTPCQLIRTGDSIPDFAVDPRPGSNTVYAAWQAHESATALGAPVDDTKARG
jgi:hypothetical protein